jgi:hypothetical protein
VIAVPKNWFERAIVNYLRWMHGGGEPQQYLFYRCRYCQRVISHRAIAKGGCVCGNNEVVPSPLSWWDKFKAVFLPWLIQH